MSVKNFLKWSDSRELARTQIIVSLMDRVEELERKEAEREARKGVPEPLQFLARKSKMPKIIS